jgi:hypothetical protein
MHMHNLAYAPAIPSALRPRSERSRAHLALDLLLIKEQAGWICLRIKKFDSNAVRLALLPDKVNTSWRRMFMLVDKKRSDELGGFGGQALHAKDYKSSRHIGRARFRVISGGIFSINRRFITMGHGTVMHCFLLAALHRRKPNYFRSSYHALWRA